MTNWYVKKIWILHRTVDIWLKIAINIYTDLKWGDAKRDEMFYTQYLYLVIPL